jgi:hypothetical protein
MIKLVFEGTAEEYEVVRDQFETEPPVTPSQNGAESAASLPHSHAYADIVRVLHRLPIPENHRRLFNALYEAGEPGLTRTALRAALDVNEGELNGILGALGRRINGTQGLHFNKGQGLSLALFLDTWKDSEWHYRLKPEVRQVLQDERLV